MALIADIVSAIIGNPAPVLFLDTCILLDVVRAPIRDKANEVEFAQLILQCVQKIPKTIHLLVPSPVHSEWTKNIVSGVNDSTTGVTACNSVSSICTLLGLPAVAALPGGVLHMPSMLRQLSADLLAACETIDHNGPAMSRAIGPYGCRPFPALNQKTAGPPGGTFDVHSASEDYPAVGDRPIFLLCSRRSRCNEVPPGKPRRPYRKAPSTPAQVSPGVSATGPDL
jgi:hypothetical protein